MCGLCAALNAGRDWTNAAGREQFKNGGRPVSVSQERTQLVRLVNGVLQHYGLTVNDWGGGSYIVTNQKAQNDNVYALGGIWTSVDALLPDEVADPLDTDLIERLERLTEERVMNA